MSTRIHEIIQKYFQNNQSKKVKKVFASWIKRESNKEEKETAFNEIWDNLNIEADRSTEKSFDKLLTTIQATNPTSGKERIPLIRRFSRIAAIIMLPILSVGVTYYLMKDSVKIDNQVQLVECIVPNGETRTITLPDSSVIKVNSGSVLIYPKQFSDSRDIFLNGEAYFTVTKDETKPFIVKTTDMDIEVLGTVFNVNAYTDSEKTSTTLESGKVNVKIKNINQDQVILIPDECVTYNRSTGLFEKSSIKVENVIAWTEGNMVIQSMTINEIIKFVERKYAMEVFLNSNKYDHERITMKVKSDESINEFMDVLKFLVPQLKYKIENNKLYIY
ncbi:FecR family protein [Dysgonomonas termitidis]|uniref:FecR family protein n=1 Tax=Dysgonomonas termitidis TaxID=1516126 RepID=A0ABV9L370_9BACT